MGFVPDNVCDHPARAVDSTQVKTADRGLGVHRMGTPVMGIGLWGLSPLCEIGISRRSVYQMTTSREQVRVEVTAEDRTSRENKRFGSGTARVAKDLAYGQDDRKWCRDDE